MLQGAHAAERYRLSGMLQWVYPQIDMPALEDSDHCECLANDLVQMRWVPGLVDQGGLGLPGALGQRVEGCCRDERVVGTSGQLSYRAQDNINIKKGSYI